MVDTPYLLVSFTPQWASLRTLCPYLFTFVAGLLKPPRLYACYPKKALRLYWEFLGSDRLRKCAWILLLWQGGLTVSGTREVFSGLTASERTVIVQCDCFWMRIRVKPVVWDFLVARYGHRVLVESTVASRSQTKATAHVNVDRRVLRAGTFRNLWRPFDSSVLLMINTIQEMMHGRQVRRGELANIMYSYRTHVGDLFSCTIVMTLLGSALIVGCF